MAKTKTILDLNQETLDNIKSSGFIPVSKEGLTVKVPVKDITDAIDNKAVNFDDTVGGTGAPSDPYSVKEMEGPYNKPAGGKVNIMGKTYDYVVINNQYWLSQNFEGDFCPTAEDLVRNGYTYINHPEGVKGKYYDSRKLLTAILPDGWRVPAGDDWINLLDYVRINLGFNADCLNAEGWGSPANRVGLNLDGNGHVNINSVERKELNYDYVRERAVYATSDNIVSDVCKVMYDYKGNGNWAVGSPSTHDFVNVRLVKDVSEEDSHDGKKGLVPKPKLGDENKVLTGAGLFVDIDDLADIPTKTSQLENDSGFGSNSFSLTEEIVGKWIDGRPIYRKFVEIPPQTYAANSWFIVNVGVNVDLVLNSFGIANGSTYYPLISTRSSTALSVGFMHTRSGSDPEFEKLSFEYVKPI